MAESFVTYTANGSTNQFAITFSYIDQSHVKVYIDNVADSSFTFVNSTTIQTSSTPSNGAVVKIDRDTPTDARLVDFADGSVISEADLDKSANQNFFIAQETNDTVADKLGKANDGIYDAGSTRIKNVANPTADQDAVTKNYLENTWLSTSDKANLTTVAGQSTEIGRLGTADAVADMNTLGTADVVADMNTLGTADVVADLNTLGTADVVSDMNTLATASNVTNMNTLASISSDITTAAGISSNITTVAGISSDVTAVAADATDIGAVAGKATEIGRLGTADAVADLAILGTADVVSDLNTLATADIVADMNTLATADVVADMNTLATADIVSDMNTLATASNVTNMDTVAGSIANVNTTAGSISNVNTVATNIANVNTTASNISDVNTFSNRYRIGSADPTSSLDAGDLFFNTTSNELKHYNGSAWSVIQADTDVKTKVSSNDTTAGFLNGKLVAGSNVTFTENSDGGNETLSIAAADNSIPFSIALG
jgi:hypothetical protein